jgi:hypothetical protein
MGYNQRAVSNLSGEERFFSAIGRFIFEFSQLEYTLKLFISKVVGLKDEHFQALMSHDFALTCAIAQTVLGKVVALEKSEDLKTLINKCRSLNDERVRVAHGLWSIVSGSGALHHVSRRKLQVSSHFQEPDALANLADSAAVLRFELAQILRHKKSRGPRTAPSE